MQIHSTHTLAQVSTYCSSEQRHWMQGPQSSPLSCFQINERQSCPGQLDSSTYFARSHLPHHRCTEPQASNDWRKATLDIDRNKYTPRTKAGRRSSCTQPHQRRHETIPAKRKPWSLRTNGPSGGLSSFSMRPKQVNFPTSFSRRPPWIHLPSGNERGSSLPSFLAT